MNIVSEWCQQHTQLGYSLKTKMQENVNAPLEIISPQCPGSSDLCEQQ